MKYNKKGNIKGYRDRTMDNKINLLTKFHSGDLEYFGKK